MLPPPISPAPATTSQTQFIWSRELHAGVLGLSLARERGGLLVWDQADWLTLLDQSGHSQAEHHFRGLVAACAADDGSAYAAVGKQGEVWWLAPDLMPRWEKKLAHPGLALTLDSFGKYLAVADRGGQLTIFDRDGQAVSRQEVPRPLYHLAFVPTFPVLAGGSDYGLVAGFNIQGEMLWRDALVASVGGLAADGEGKCLLLACFSEGLHRYGSDGSKQDRLPTPEPCRLVSQSFDGKRILFSNLNQGLFLLDAGGQPLLACSLDKPVTALALGALGKDAFVGLARGPVLRLGLESRP